MTIHAYSAYRKVQVETAPPHKLIAMLLQAAAVRCETAEVALSKGLSDEARPLTLKAQEIVAELMASLDYDKGRELAERLCMLYDFVYRRLADAHLRQDASGAGDAARVLRALADAWNTLRPGGDEQPSDATVRVAGPLAY